MYKAYNHNGTLIAESKKASEIFKMAKEYHDQTGNAYFIEEEEPKKFLVSVEETQRWTYVYEVEAYSKEDAELIAQNHHFDGVQSYDNWLDESSVESIRVKEKENDREEKTS